jgi:peroxiredoxin-like protein
MTRAKAFRFPVAVEWKGGPMTVATIGGKPDLAVATPPELGSGVEGVWSPEDLLVASAATCYAVTLSAIARRGNIALSSMGVSGVGQLGPRDDGRFGFTSIDLAVDVETETADSVEAAEEAAERAERGCLIAMALAVPVNVSVSVRAAAGATVLPAA